MVIVWLASRPASSGFIPAGQQAQLAMTTCSAVKCLQTDQLFAKRLTYLHETDGQKHNSLSSEGTELWEKESHWPVLNCIKDH